MTRGRCHWHKGGSHQRLTQWEVIAIALILSSCGLPLGNQRVTPPAQGVGAKLNSRSMDHQGSLSQDGRYLVFASDRLAQRSIFLYETRSRQLISLPGLNQPGVMHDQPDISGDGRFIVYVSDREGKSDIFIYDRVSMKSQRLTQDLFGEVQNPSISGNGRFVIFESNRTGQWDIEIIDRGVVSP
jgi:Tol biopolymer transport system component